jgi:hypothetical protein
MISSRMYTEKSFKSMFERLTASGILTWILSGFHKGIQHKNSKHP